MGKNGRKFIGIVVDIFTNCPMIKIVIDIYIMLIIHKRLNRVQRHPSMMMVMHMVMMIIIWMTSVMVVIVVVVVNIVLLPL